jgi:hypothetical protein
MRSRRSAPPGPAPAAGREVRPELAAHFDSLFSEGGNADAE